ncbi:MAG TPA: hypothetical protein VFP84_24545 [Kofleriaceae bacterium]|nr:hypothetical protein [Kofleriaceae bacterium]
MNEVTVKVRVHLVIDGDLQDEAAIAAWIAEGNTVLLREKRDLNGAICIGDVEIVDELFSAVQRLCLRAPWRCLWMAGVSSTDISRHLRMRDPP